MNGKFLTFVAILLATVMLSLAACSKKPEAVGVKTEESQASETEALDAFRRNFKHADKFCHLPEYGYLAFFDQTVSDDWKAEWNGWFLYKYGDVTLYYSPKNKTWFTNDPDPNKSVKIYPDVNGLTCMDKLP